MSENSYYCNVLLRLFKKLALFRYSGMKSRGSGTVFVATHAVAHELGIHTFQNQDRTVLCLSVIVF